MQLILLAAILAGTPDAPDVRDDEIEDAVKERGTIGLIITGALTAGAYGVTIGRVGVMRHNCPLREGAACTFDEERDFTLMVTRLALSTSTLALAPGTGASVGGHAAWKAATAGAPARDPRRIAGVGGAFVGAGALGIGAAAWMSVGLSGRCVRVQENSDDDLAGERCISRALPAWSFLSVSSFALAATGLGLLGYSVRYRNTRAKIARAFVMTGRHEVGIGVAGRF